MNTVKKVAPLLVVGLIVLIVVGFALTSYNSLVANDEEVSTSWGNLQSQYQRRSDLIPNLVKVVKGYAKHESKTLTDVVEARAKATQVTIDPDNITPEKLQQLQAAQGQLSTALGRLMVVVEKYPQLQANENFSELQTQLEGTENRINESRRLYNSAVQKYNLSVRRFPGNLVAGMFGFEKKSKFEADEKAQTAPTVNFD